LSNKDVLLEQDSNTCKLCEAKFESLGEMQSHVLTEHMQKGDYQIPLKNIEYDIMIAPFFLCNLVVQYIIWRHYP